MNKTNADRNISLYGRHIISISDLNKAQVCKLIEKACELKKCKKYPKVLSEKTIATCFFEASTRTRLSFEAAALSLGASVIGFADSSNTSFSAKNESLIDTIRVVNKYADAIIIRHPQEGAARLASEVSDKVVINAGDGANQHPTQTLLDLLSIHETQGRLDNLRIAMVGDLKYGRTVHSLLDALSMLFENNKFYFISPKDLSLPEFLIGELKRRKVLYKIHDSLKDVVDKVDIIYMTRIQKERLNAYEYASIKSQFILDNNHLQYAKDNCRVLHPLPRREEIDVNVDNSKHAYYFQQAENGFYMRKALLSLLLKEQC